MNTTPKKRVRGKPFPKGWRGGPGRPPGKPNRVTRDLRDVRREILESWHRCDGPKLLDEMARNDPASYLKLVASVLPKPLGDEAERLPDIKIVILQSDYPAATEADQLALPEPPPAPKLLPKPEPIRVRVEPVPEPSVRSGRDGGFTDWRDATRGL